MHKTVPSCATSHFKWEFGVSKFAGRSCDHPHYNDMLLQLIFLVLIYIQFSELLRGLYWSMCKKSVRKKPCLFIFEIHLFLMIVADISLGVNYARNHTKHFKFIISFNCTTCLRNRWFHLPHFTSEETEVLKRCKNSSRWPRVGP